MPSRARSKTRPACSRPGDRLGAYEITGFLGRGGMGEVYRARDTKLNRDVALKILPERVCDRLRTDSRRFRREAQVLASLNHPNIGHIYGLEDAATPHALVLELVDGPTLAELIDAAVDHAPSAHRHAQGALSSSKGASEARQAAGVGASAASIKIEVGEAGSRMKPIALPYRPSDRGGP